MSTATATEDEEVPTLRLLACVIAGVVVAVGTFALTWSLLLSILLYVLVACASYALTWVLLQ